MADIPARPDFVHIKSCFLSKGCGATEDEADGAEVVLCTFGLVAEELNENRRDESHLLDFVALNSGEQGFELEAREDDRVVAIVDAYFS